MTKNSSLTVLAAVLMCGGMAWAKAPASAPAGTTGMCKDGSYTSAESKSGACSGHDGVKKWYGVPAEASAAQAAASDEKAPASEKHKSKGKSESAAPAASAAAPMAAATGLCKDGTPTSASSKAGACSGHGGVKDWYSATAAAPAPAAAPATAMKAAAPTAASATVVGATGICKDGTATSTASKSGACSNHGGVKEWYAAGAAGAAMSASAPPAAVQTKAATNASPAMAAPGGGPGRVWANSSSKVYHCPDDQWYGKTKEGSYMTEADAIAKGYRADHGKACH